MIINNKQTTDNNSVKELLKTFEDKKLFEGAVLSEELEKAERVLSFRESLRSHEQAPSLCKKRTKTSELITNNTIAIIKQLLYNEFAETVLNVNPGQLVLQDLRLAVKRAFNELLTDELIIALIKKEKGLTEFRIELSLAIINVIKQYSLNNETDYGNNLKTIILSQKELPAFQTLVKDGLREYPLSKLMRKEVLEQTKELFSLSDSLIHSFRVRLPKELTAFETTYKELNDQSKKALLEKLYGDSMRMEDFFGLFVIVNDEYEGTLKKLFLYSLFFAFYSKGLIIDYKEHSIERMISESVIPDRLTTQNALFLLQERRVFFETDNSFVLEAIARLIDNYAFYKNSFLVGIKEQLPLFLYNSLWPYSFDETLPELMNEFPIESLINYHSTSNNELIIDSIKTIETRDPDFQLQYNKHRLKQLVDLLLKRKPELQSIVINDERVKRLIKEVIHKDDFSEVLLLSSFKESNDKAALSVFYNRIKQAIKQYNGYNCLLTKKEKEDSLKSIRLIKESLEELESTIKFLAQNDDDNYYYEYQSFKQQAIVLLSEY